MNKGDIEFCPYCKVVLKANEVNSTPAGDLQVNCDFCNGVFQITELSPPMSQEKVQAKWQDMKPPKD